MNEEREAWQLALQVFMDAHDEVLKLQDTVRDHLEKEEDDDAK